jgi:hypothetical protein
LGFALILSSRVLFFASLSVCCNFIVLVSIEKVQNISLSTTFVSGLETARNDDGPADVQTAIKNVSFLDSIAGSGGLLQIPRTVVGR